MYFLYWKIGDIKYKQIQKLCACEIHSYVHFITSLQETVFRVHVYFSFLCVHTAIVNTFSLWKTCYCAYGSHPKVNS